MRRADVTEAENTKHETRNTKLSRGMFLRAVVAALVVAGGVVTVRAVERGLNLTFDKPPMPLSQPLSFLSKEIGGPAGGPARYVATGLDRTMTEDVLEVLGTREYLLRRYTDTKKPAEDPTAA